jgi:flagellar hook-length control protein FliK
MLRLSALLPIIEVTPVQDHDSGRNGHRSTANEKAVANEVQIKKAIADTASQLIQKAGAEPVLKSANPGIRSPAKRGAQETESGSQPESLANDTPAKSVKSASYGIVSLLNPLLDDSAAPLPSHETRFSQTATLLTNLMKQEQPSKQSGHISNAAPLINGAPTNPAVLAIALRNAITQSGLFYESHLEQWMNGSRATEVIKQEPQASLPPTLLFTPADINNTGNDHARPAAGQEQIAWLQQNLVQQLSILNNPTLIWSGQAWPNQQVTVQTEEGSPGSGGSETPWVTRLTLEMPRMGKVDVLITLDSMGVDIAIKSDSPRARTTLQKHQLELDNRLVEAGCRLKRVKVDREHE